MVDLLPSARDTSAADEAEPRVIGIDSEHAHDTLSALSSETGRRLLASLHEEPAAPSEVAERVDTSLQNAQYHLGKLENADVIEVVDTVYSEKGREMNVYAPADRPLVVFAGNDAQSSELKTALSRLLGGLGLLAVLSLVVERLLADRAPIGGADDVVGPGIESADAAGTAIGLPPGALFFAGGAVVLLALFALWYLRRARAGVSESEM